MVVWLNDATAAHARRVPAPGPLPENRLMSGGAIALLSRLSGFACLGLRKLGVGSIGANLARRRGSAAALLALAVAHRFLEPAHRVAQIAPDRRELLGAEHHQHDEQNHDQLAHPNTHNLDSRPRSRLMRPMIGQKSQ